VTTSGWRRISDLFEQALDVPAEERAAWLASLPDAPAVLQEVESMLAAHERHDGVLDRPVLAASDAGMLPHLSRALAERYVIEREIGRGGMATVYLARERKHDRLVVLKVLKPQIAEALGAHRFLTEVQIAARLSHPHILGFIDSGDADGLLFYVMPWVGGETLRELLRREGRVEPRVAMTYLCDLAAALRHAHTAGIVHRDLKPENVLCIGGHAYLLDFGIAKMRDAPLPTGFATGTGIAIGTMGYMAPEQASGEAVDHRADLYSWGVLAREMLTGEGPLDLAAGLASLPRGIPGEIARLIAASLSRKPADRPSSAEELVAAFDRWRAAGAPLGSAPVQRRVHRATPWALGAAGVAAVALLLFRTDARDDAPDTLAVAPAVTTDGRLAMPVAVAAFSNETGDTALGTWGRLAGDWITQGLQQTGLVEVVPWPYALQASTSWATRTAAGDSLSRVAVLREETGAGTIVTGSYYLIGDRLRVQVEITDAASGTLLTAPPPVEAPRDSVEVALAALRERTMGALAVRTSAHVSDFPELGELPPTYAAYRAFDRGVGFHLAQDYSRAASEYIEAFRRDTTFAVALIYAAQSLWNDDQFARADSVLRALRASGVEVSEYHELLADYMEAHLSSDGERALSSIRRAAALAPASRAPYNLAFTALQQNRPREARSTLAALDPDHGSMRNWPSYWTQRAHAHHLLGEHAEERAAAREMARRFPSLRVALTLEIRPLAAQGNVAAIDSLLRRAAALPPDTYWSQGGAMVTAGEELAAHGHAAAARRYFDRAVAWLANQLAREPAHKAHREWLGLAHYGAGRWADAAPYFESLDAENSSRDLNYRGYRALIRARRGDSRAATRLGEPAPHELGRHTAFRARIAAVSGDTAAAVSLMSQALGHGIDGFPWLHGSAYPDLAPLRTSEAFVRLMTPD
jgi:tRNA A-37 threonylcarbamoyl transferase component Bud32/tetratricopeptide (TPR) repeat protein/TolB-like protein